MLAYHCLTNGGIDREKEKDGNGCKGKEKDIHTDKTKRKQMHRNLDSQRY